MSKYYSGDPGDEHMERTERLAAALNSLRCACKRCAERVDPNAYCYPYCDKCYANVDGKCEY